MRQTNLAARIAAALAIFILCGCAAKEEAQGEGAQAAAQEDMVVVVDFRDVHRCSRISPEITIQNPPQGTKFYDVRLVERGATERFLGGGRWTEDGGGVIPEGALTRHYTGPCPKSGKTPEYIYVVSAMSEPEGQPLAVRLERLNLD